MRAGEEEEGEEEDEQEDEDDLYARDPARAEELWRGRTKKALRLEAVSRWAASQVAVDREMATLKAQLRAVELMESADTLDATAAGAFVQQVVAANSESEAVMRLLGRWRDEIDTGSWTAAFSAPRLKCPQITTFLSENRSERARAWLKLQREEHSLASRSDRAIGVMGDAYSSAWPFSSVPSAVNAPGDHVVAREHLSPNASLILEHADPAQNVINITITSLENNSSKGEKSINIFLGSERIATAFAPTQVSDAKRNMLAKVVAATFCSYAGISAVSKATKGVASLTKSSGNAIYARGLGSPYYFERRLRAASSAWERHVALLTLGMAEFQVANPFVLYPAVATDELLAVLSQRFVGSTDPILKLCDEALRDSVLRAPR